MDKNHSRISFIFSYFVFAVIFIFVSLLFILFCGEFNSVGEVSAPEDDPMPVVIIDAGHGGEDGGTIGVNGCLEKDLNLIMAKKLKTLLTSMGVKCVLTRSEDMLLYDRNADFEGQKKRLDMQARLDIVNSYDNAVFISIHQNAFPIEKYSGAQIYYSQNNEASRSLALSIEQSIRSTLQPDNNRASKPSDGKIYLLDKLSCPSVLIECGFLSNAEECALLCTEEYQNHICAVIASSVERFLAS